MYSSYITDLQQGRTTYMLESVRFPGGGISVDVIEGKKYKTGENKKRDKQIKE
jgi:hypothetical protein